MSVLIRAKLGWQWRLDVQRVLTNRAGIDASLDTVRRLSGPQAEIVFVPWTNYDQVFDVIVKVGVKVDIVGLDRSILKWGA